MKRLIFVALLLFSIVASAQTADSTAFVPTADTVYVRLVDTVVVRRIDTVSIVRRDTIVRREVDTAALSAMKEKERFYREILSSNGVDKEKLEAERNHYIHLVDSLRAVARVAEIEAVRREEANKYLAERARVAEEKVAQTTSKKKKIRPIQGVALRFYRAPNWEIRLKGGSTEGSYEKYLSNRNAGTVDFDYVTGASVMLWDMTPLFNGERKTNSGRKLPEIPRFDQQFNYDLGIYVGFGGSNLFRNFYVGPSFRFVDFFYFTAGVNIAEFQVLKEGYENGQVIGPSLSIEDVTAAAWLVNAFFSLSIDLDFLSSIKR